MPAWFLCDRRSYGSRSGGTAAAVVTTPTQLRAIRTARRRGRGGRRVGHGPQSEHRGGGFIFVELLGRRLEEEEEEREFLDDVEPDPTFSKYICVC